MKFLLLILLVSLGGLFFIFNKTVPGEKIPEAQTSDKITPKVSLQVEVSKNVTDKIISTKDQDLISKAQDLYKVKKSEGMDFSDGPCLSENIAPDWVLDIAHNPRTAIDNDPKNQCSNFRNGTAHHFIELDPLGRFIRSY